MAEGTIWHGGDLAQAQALFPDAPKPWIDLSTGINPIPYPLPELPLSLWQHLPGSSDEAALLAAARAAYRVADGIGIVAAPGTQILIEMLPRLVGTARVAVLGPTYAEHEAAWRKAGADVVMVSDLGETGEASVTVLVNPNNPDGRVVPTGALQDLAAQCRAKGGLLVIDEAFADFAPETSILPTLPPGALVLRSFGKTYGLAGLRLGFAIGEPPLIEALRSALGPWAVAGPALHVGALALRDTRWLMQAGADRRADAARLDTLLARHGRVLGGTALFRLLATPDAPPLFAHLGRQGLYVRRFQNDATWLRFGLPGDAAAWARLEAALVSFSH
ncbi:threonine-phosphate decarboxylase CobD [Bosea sp. PAMC 26642]|uniref:threonine-phosphate decarboxylase CobD n=1 Tax=Bosea sp. (strain PAMC 26642) TaxID=1792307 RepID=UPI000A835A07